MAHELGHLLLTDHMGNDYCLMNDGTVNRASSVFVYLFYDEFNQTST